MKQELAVKVLAVIPKAFTGNDGEAVSYNETYFLSENEEGMRDVFKLNTKLDLTKHEGESIVIEVEFDVSGERKPRLIRVV